MSISNLLDEFARVMSSVTMTSGFIMFASFSLSDIMSRERGRTREVILLLRDGGGGSGGGHEHERETANEVDVVRDNGGGGASSRLSTP
jgi:hypothetical protein